MWKTLQKGNNGRYPRSDPKQVLGEDEAARVGTAEEAAFRRRAWMRKLCENTLTLLLSAVYFYGHLQSPVNLCYDTFYWRSPK